MELSLIHILLNHSILNLVVWGVLTGVIAYALYYEDMDKPLRRIIEDVYKRQIIHISI